MAPLLFLLGLAASGLSAQTTKQKEIKLPDLGDASSAIVSSRQERELGQMWLRVYRSRVATSSDPLIQDYTEQLIAKLAEHSTLKKQPLDLVVVKNPTINAFAVPGGVIGVHTGLFISALTEGQFSSVMAHELAHLSQRHFARGVEARRNATLPTMAAMLASLVIAATVGGDAGLAAITATQAAAQQNQLRFSRQNEQEADRIGMTTLANAGMDPHAMPAMFEQLLRNARYSRRPPEFLLSHPLTEKRVADSKNRANRFPQKIHPVSLDYQLMRARVRLAHSDTPQMAVKHFRSELEGDTLSKAASRYALALALARAGQPDAARKTLKPLVDSNPQKVAYIIAQVEIDHAAEDFNAAVNRLKKHLSQQPGNYPLTIAYADSLSKAGAHEASVQLLNRYARQRPKDPLVWFMLAETAGLAGDIGKVHQARAEWFILNGIFSRAIKQLNNALKLAKGNYHQTAILEERLRNVQDMQLKAKL